MVLLALTPLALADAVRVDVTISAVPEPRGVAVALAMLLGVMVGSRRWLGVKP